MVNNKIDNKREEDRKNEGKRAEGAREDGGRSEGKKKSFRHRRNKKSAHRRDEEKKTKARKEEEKREGGLKEEVKKGDDRKLDGSRKGNKKNEDRKEEHKKREGKREGGRRNRRRDGNKKGTENAAASAEKKSQEALAAGGSAEVKDESVIPAAQGEKKLPAVQEEKKPSAAQGEKKLPAAQEDKKSSAAQEDKKLPAVQGEKMSPAAQGEKKAEGDKAEQQPAAEAALEEDNILTKEKEAIDDLNLQEESEGAESGETVSEKTEETQKKEGNPPAEKVKVEVIGVRFRDNGKIYYFHAGEMPVKVGDNVIVETARGVEYGKVVLGNRVVEEQRIISTLKPVIRIATSEDDKVHQENKRKSEEAFAICLDKIRQHGLEMKLIDCEYTFDNNKVLFYFTADGRIDFRELVKDLAAVFKTRIELRQIGVRDETKIKGGIGICGRSLCCHTHLSEFIPVSIKMAKEQNLSLNPTKISGVCGRLMCCLKHEQDTYEYLNKKLPNPGDEVRLPEGGKGVVQSVNVLRQKVRVIITDEKDEKELVEYNATELSFHSKKKKEKVKVDAELKKLEALEKKERKSNLS